MKIKLIIILLLLCSFNLNAQKFSKSLKNSIVESSNVKKSDNTDYTLTKSYIIEAKKEDDSKYYKIEILSDNDIKEAFLLYPLSIDLFMEKFKRTFLKVVDQAEGITSSATTEFNELELSLLFAQLFTFQRTENERPVVAEITLKKGIPVMIMKKVNEFFIKEWKNSLEKVNPDGSKLSHADKKEINDKYKKEGDEQYELVQLNEAKLELTFFNGYIEKIELEAMIKSKKIRFTNIYSVGISSSNGIKGFVNNYINSFYTYSIVDNKLKRDSNGSLLKINLADIIDYDREIDINANDISPEPTKLILDESERTVKLYKEESTKLFEAIVFSDFLGVFDEENPNGILQTEVAKKFYINNHRYQITPRGRWLGLLFPPVAFSEGYGWFEYLDLSARLSKIEENNKYLSADILNDISYFSPLRIMQHQSFSIGADLNLLYLENQNKKINTNLDIGLRYGRSGLEIDGETQDFFNNITTSAELGFQFIPEKRYGFIASTRVSYFQVYNDDGFVLKSIEDGEIVKPKLWFNKTQFEFFVNTSTTGKLFIRYNFLTELDDWDNNFSQFQFGYSFYLLKQNGKTK